MKNWNRPLTKAQEEKYIMVCSYAFGGAPVDVDWAIGTSIYQNKEAELVSRGIINEQPLIVPIKK